MPVDKKILLAIKNEMPKVFEVFTTSVNDELKADSMDDAYVKLIRAHHNVITADKYSNEYIAEHKQEVKKAITDLKRAYLEKAKTVINEIKEKYTEQPKLPDRPADEVAYQMQRNNNLTLWTAQLPVATVDELRELFYEHKFDEDFISLLQVELRKRQEEPAALKLKFEIDNPAGDANFIELDKLEKSLTFVLNNHYYPHGLTNGIEGLSYREVDKDLAAYPFEDGATYRPVFKLKELAKQDV